MPFCGNTEQGKREGGRASNASPNLISEGRRKKRGGLKGRGFGRQARNRSWEAGGKGICTASKPNRPNHNKNLRLRCYHSALVDVQLCVGMTKILCLTYTAAYGQAIIKVKQEQEKNCRSHGQRLLLSPCSHRFAKTLILCMLCHICYNAMLYAQCRLLLAIFAVPSFLWLQKEEGTSTTTAFADSYYADGAEGKGERGGGKGTSLLRE